MAKSVCGHIEEDAVVAGTVKIIEQRERSFRLPHVAHAVIVDEIGLAQYVKVSARDLRENNLALLRRDQRLQPLAAHCLDDGWREKMHVARRIGIAVYQRFAMTLQARDIDRVGRS